MNQISKWIIRGPKLFFALALLVVIISANPTAGLAQTGIEPHAFAAEVETFRRWDRQFQVPPHPIVFTGSSSIRKWDNLQVAFGSYNVINRGIGGAVTNDITYFLKDLVFAYQPRQLILYVGENDLPDNGTTADSILQRTIRLFTAIREKLPDVPIVYVCMKPSPSREQFRQKEIEGNKLIRNYLLKDKNVFYLDVYSLMLTPDGHSRPELFVGDRLHMNPLGYAIWERALKPHLLLK